MSNAAYITIMVVLAFFVGAFAGIYFYKKWLLYEQSLKEKEDERRRRLERRIIAMRLMAKRNARLSRNKSQKDN